MLSHKLNIKIMIIQYPAIILFLSFYCYVTLAQDNSIHYNIYTFEKAIEDLKSDDHYERMEAICSLGDQIGDTKKSVEILKEFWSSIDSKTENKEKFYEKMNIAISLWKLGVKEHITFVFDQVESSKPERRTQAAILLSMINTPESRNALIKIFKNDTFFPAIFASASGLGKIGTKDIIPLLKEKKYENLGNLNSEIDKAINSIINRNNQN